MKKVFFSMAGIALLAGSALAFTTAKSNTPPSCDDPSVPENCTEPTNNINQACCVQDNEGTPQYFRLKEEN